MPTTRKVARPVNTSAFHITEPQQVRTLGGKERRDGRLRCALSLSGLFFATRNEVEKAGKPRFEIGFSQRQFGAVAVVVLDDQTRLAEDAKVMCHRGLGHLDAEAKLHEALVAER